MYNNALIIINPASGGGVSKEKIQKITDKATELGWKGKLVETTKDRSASDIAQQYISNGIDHVIICGGDGSVREILKAVIYKNVNLGIVPLGTGNVYSKDLGIPQQIDEAVKVALLGTPLCVDVGMANGKLFNLVAGIGIDADIMKKTSKAMKGSMGVSAYVLTIFKQISKRGKKYKIILDGKKTLYWRASAILVANIGKTAIGINFAPGAEPTSGDFRVAILKIRSYFELFRLILSSIIGRLDLDPNYKIFEAKNVEIIPLSGPTSYECDGDVFSPTEKLEISIFARSVSVLVP